MEVTGIILCITIIVLVIWIRALYYKIDTIRTDLRIEKMTAEMHEQDAQKWESLFNKCLDDSWYPDSNK